MKSDNPVYRLKRHNQNHAIDPPVDQVYLSIKHEIRRVKRPQEASFMENLPSLQAAAGLL